MSYDPQGPAASEETFHGHFSLHGFREKEAMQNSFRNKIFASEQAIPDAEHRGITPALTRLVNVPDAKNEEHKVAPRAMY